MTKVAIIANNKKETQDVYHKLQDAIAKQSALPIDEDKQDVV